MHCNLSEFMDCIVEPKKMYTDALSKLSPSCRGHRIETIVKRIDQRLNPWAIITGPNIWAENNRRCAYQSGYDYLRNQKRIEVKHSSIHRIKNGWYVNFQGIKQDLHDELLLVVYSPKHLFITKYVGKQQLSSGGPSKVGRCIQRSARVDTWQEAVSQIVGATGVLIATVDLAC